jgi:hypothetical protein
MYRFTGVWRLPCMLQIVAVGLVMTALVVPTAMADKNDYE